MVLVIGRHSGRAMRLSSLSGGSCQLSLDYSSTKKRDTCDDSVSLTRYIMDVVTILTGDESPRG